MQTFKTSSTIARGGELHLVDLPFEAGEQVEVVVHSTKAPRAGKNRYPLRGLPIRYQDPTAPVAEEDWEATK